MLNLPDSLRPASGEVDISPGTQWRQHLAWTQLAIDHRRDLEWWRAERPDPGDGLNVRFWVLALLGVVSHDSTRELLTRAIIGELPTLMRDGLVDLHAVRELDNITIKIDELRGARSYSLDSLLEGCRLTGLNVSKARQILSAPHEWPPIVVQAAAQRLSQKAARASEALAVTADKKDWFPAVPWRPRAYH